MLWPFLFIITVLGVACFIVVTYRVDRSQIRNRQVNELIPRKAHFIYGLWDTQDRIPVEYRQNISRWRKRGYTVRVWNKTDIERLVEEDYPQFRQLYNKLPRNVQRADLARYMVIHAHGGYYFDCDTSPVSLHSSPSSSSSSPSLRNTSGARAIFLIEQTITPFRANQAGERYAIREGRPERLQRLTNYAFAAVAGHQVLMEMIREASRRLGRRNFDALTSDDYGVLYTTGPDMVTDVVSRRVESVGDVLLVEAKSFVIHSHDGRWLRFGDES